jgi:transcriptional regulator with XRE-family HTH domain
MPKPVIDPALEARLQAQAARLRRVRIALEISQAEAARTAGVSVFKWNRMELGQHHIDPLALQIFCDAHRIGADYVITAIRSTLPEWLQEKTRDIERDELEKARNGTLPPHEAADIWQRLAQAPPPPPSPPARPTSPRRKPKKVLHSLLGVVA